MLTQPTTTIPATTQFPGNVFLLHGTPSYTTGHQQLPGLQPGITVLNTASVHLLTENFPLHSAAVLFFWVLRTEPQILGTQAIG